MFKLHTCGLQREPHHLQDGRPEGSVARGEGGESRVDAWLVTVRVGRSKLHPLRVLRTLLGTSQQTRLHILSHIVPMTLRFEGANQPFKALLKKPNNYS
jgi:hypothetical protein